MRRREKRRAAEGIWWPRSSVCLPWGRRADIAQHPLECARVLHGEAKGIVIEVGIHGSILARPPPDVLRPLLQAAGPVEPPVDHARAVKPNVDSCACDPPRTG